MSELDMTNEAPGRTSVRAVLSDGRIVTLRPLQVGDLDSLYRLHTALPARDLYFRFFSMRPTGIEQLCHRLVRSEGVHQMALGAFLGDTLVGAAHFEVLADPAEAEVAIVVDHDQQGCGLGTLLLEHLASAARARGVRRFLAEVLTENAAMVRVFQDAGLPTTMRSAGTSCQVTTELVGDYLPAIRERERGADVASLRTLLRPRSVAVVGASRRDGAIGNAVLRNLLAAGFTGTCHPVNPHARVVAGVETVPSVRDLPANVDLAVVCVPAAAVPEVAEHCGERGIRALVVLTSGLHAELSSALRAAARRHAMRLVGPNCLGVINTDEEVRLDTTFAPGPAPRGRIGVVTQSGGVAIALLRQFAPAGLGVSTLVSTGDKYDVSSNDLLMWWQRDDDTDLAVIYVESFGNPRKFSKLARKMAEQKPVIAVRTGRTEAAQRAAASHTSAAATPTVTRDALFRQAGVIPVESLTDVLGAACLLSWQPLPLGARVAVVGNVGGIGVLAADTCAEHGLALPELAEPTRETLRSLLPVTASVHNPVDTTAGIPDPMFHRCVRAVLGDPQTDAVLVIAAPTAVSDPSHHLADAVAGATKPVLAVRVGQTATIEALRPADSSENPMPAFGDPTHAVEALARCVAYGTWRARPPGTVPDLPDIDIASARATVSGCLAADPRGGWLDPATTSSLLRCFGLPVEAGVVTPDVDTAVAAFGEAGCPVAMKAIAEDVRHKSRAGGVILDVVDEPHVRAGFATLRERFGLKLQGVLIQPMAHQGRELLVGVHSDPTFGPLVAFGLGGVDTDLVADRTYRLAPLTDQDAHEMLGALRSSSALFGELAQPWLDTDAIIDALLRVGRLAELLPEVAELDINPLIAATDGCQAVDARVRIEPREPFDPFLRRLA